MSASVSFGIDLGTTNSCISMLRSDSTIPTIIPLKYGDTIPSCVMLTKDNQLVVGKEAYQSRYAESSIYSVKRMIGTNNIIHLKNGLYSRDLTPVEVSAEILKQIVKEAEEYVGDGLIHDITITVPAHFNDNQRRDTKRAGELAGLNVVSIINEPTSAGLLYGLDKAKSNQTILVYDLGGGTFDVSILKVVKEFKKFPLLGINMNNEYNKTAINILGNDGDVHLGGDDIDDAIVDYVIESIANMTGDASIDVRNWIESHEEGIEHLKLRIEISKVLGRSSIDVEYRLEDYSIKLSGSEFEEKCYRPIFNRTYEYITKAMSSAGVSFINNIVLVGGSTKSPIIRKMIKEKFPNINIMSTFEPDLSVGLGASISSASVLGINDIASITDVVPMSIGIVLDADEVSNEKIFSKVLIRDKPLPCIERREYEIQGDDDSVLTIDIRQGESIHNIDKLVKIGELRLPASMFENNTLVLEYKCDLNGVLSVVALTTEGERSVDVHYTANESASIGNSNLSVLDKAQLFFYNNRLKKLKKAGYDDGITKIFTPELVMEGLDVADSVFKHLIDKIKK